MSESSIQAAAGIWRARRVQLVERILIALIIVTLLAALDVTVVAAVNPIRVLAGKHYYLALGDSITFGYQPNLDFSSGYVDDVFGDLRGAGVDAVLNLACAGESTSTMAAGGCPFRLIHHDAYTGAQLDAAGAFLRKHPGAVSPITLDIGANDVLPDWSDGACAPRPGAEGDLAAMDRNLTQSILPRLEEALGGSGRPVDFVLLNYYDPFARVCPDSLAFVGNLNAHLAADAAPFHIPVVDVYGAFGGDAHAADLVCTYTWYCDAQYHHDYHPTSAGYRAIAQAVERVLSSGSVRGGAIVPAIPPFNWLG